MPTLAEYQVNALRTAMSEAHDHAYLLPSIVGEVGELFGKKGKAVRDHWSKERLENELAAEYGDICWMAAVLLNLHDVHEIPEGYRDRRELEAEPWLMLLEAATALYEAPMFGNSVRRNAILLWIELEEHCSAITGHTFDEVLNLNTKKLLDRQSRGVLTGSGDNR